MPRRILKVDIAAIAHMLKTRKKSNQGMVLVLGSRAGGLFHNQSFYDIMKEYSTRNFNPLTPEEQFTECHKILQRGTFGENEIDIILTGALKELPTTEANICIAELTKRGFFDVIISTNIDTVLEDAFKDIGMKEKHDFEVLLPEQDFSEDVVHPDRRFASKIIKTFGDLPSRVYNVTKRDFYFDKVPHLKNYLEDTLARDILVVGFDPVWDAEILRAFPIRKSPLWLVSEEEVSTKHPLTLPEKYGRYIRVISGNTGSSDKFFKYLYWNIQGETIAIYDWKRDILNELSFMRNSLNHLETIHNDVHTIHLQIQHLEEKMDHYFDKNGGNII